MTDVSDYDVPTTIKIVFSQNYGGDADIDQRWMVFNLSPVELWVGEEKYTDFKPMVFHFETLRKITTDKKNYYLPADGERWK